MDGSANAQTFWAGVMQFVTHLGVQMLAQRLESVQRGSSSATDVAAGAAPATLAMDMSQPYDHDTTAAAKAGARTAPKAGRGAKGGASSKAGGKADGGSRKRRKVVAASDEDEKEDDMADFGVVSVLNAFGCSPANSVSKRPNALAHFLCLNQRMT